MEWPEELKFSLKRSAGKKGRRAGEDITDVNLSPEKSTGDSLDLELDLSLTSRDSKHTAPPRRRTSGGWADNATKSGRNKTIFDDDRLISPIRTPTEANFKDNIPVIPDLDDIQDEILMNEVIEPPSVTVNRTVTLKELNSELLKQNTFSSLEDVDLSILTKFLQSQHLLEEDDKSWNWDQIFTEITAEINVEKSPSKRYSEGLDMK